MNFSSCSARQFENCLSGRLLDFDFGCDKRVSHQQRQISCFVLIKLTPQWSPSIHLPFPSTSQIHTCLWRICPVQLLTRLMAARLLCHEHGTECLGLFSASVASREGPTIYCKDLLQDLIHQISLQPEPWWTSCCKMFSKNFRFYTL